MKQRERQDPDLSTNTKKTMILLLENDKYMNEAFDLIDQLAHDGGDQEKRESLIFKEQAFFKLSTFLNEFLVKFTKTKQL